MVPMLPIHSARAQKTRGAHIRRILFSALAHGADAEVATLANTLNLNAEIFTDTGNMPLKISGQCMAYRLHIYLGNFLQPIDIPNANAKVVAGTGLLAD